jgi:RES domain-containing protein
MAIVYRIIHRKWMDSVLSGEGARIFGGRWNKPGSEVVYTASSRSLATLEMLVHTGSDEIPDERLIASIEIPDHLIDVVSRLPKGWDDIPPQKASMEYGSLWLKSNGLPALRVPSVVIKDEFNVLIDPMHVDFKSISVVKIESLDLDPRLLP